MNLDFPQEEESSKPLEMSLEEQWVRFKQQWQKGSHVSLSSDKYKNWYPLMWLKSCKGLKPPQHLDCVELEFCGSGALDPQDGDASLSFQIANDLFLKSEASVIASMVMNACHTNCVGSKRKRDDACAVKFACSVAEAAALLVGWQPQAALSILSALLNCWPVIALLPAINVLSCVPALPGRDLGYCMARSLAVAKDEGRAPSYVRLSLNVLSTQPHRIFRFLPLSVLGGSDRELLEVLRFVQRSLFRCTKSLERGLRVAVLRTCDECCCCSSSNPMSECNADNEDDEQPPLCGNGSSSISERYAAVEMLLLIVGGIGGENLCDFTMRCTMRMVSHSLKRFTPLRLGVSQHQQQSLIRLSYSLNVLVGLMEYCPLKDGIIDTMIRFQLHLAFTEYENIISHSATPSSLEPCGWRRQQHKDAKNLHRCQWLIIRWALSVSLLKLSDRQLLCLKSELAIVFDVDELSADEEKALSADELMLEQRLVDLHIIRQQSNRLYHEGQCHRRGSSSSPNPDVSDKKNSRSNLAKKSKFFTMIKTFQEDDAVMVVNCPVRWYRHVMSQERIMTCCALLRQFPKCLAFIQRVVPFNKRKASLSSDTRDENAKSFNCMVWEESSTSSLCSSSILRDGNNFPTFVLELVLDFFAPKRVCRASCVCSLWHYVCCSPPYRIWAKQFERRWPFRSFSDLNEWLRARVRPPVTFVETKLDDFSSSQRFPTDYVKVDWLMMFRNRWISEMKARRGRKRLIVCPCFNCASLIQGGKAAFKRHLRSAHDVQVDDNTDIIPPFRRGCDNW